MLTTRGPIIIRLDQISISFFTRVALDQDRVEFFQQLYELGQPVPPIIVTDSKEEGAREYDLLEGRHRYQALLQADIPQTRAMVATTASVTENIIESLRANMGGALPPSRLDFLHVIELLINQGLKKQEIIEKFPLHKSHTAGLHKLVMNRLYKGKVGSAVRAFVKGGLTLEQAAEKFRVKPDDLREVMEDRQARGSSFSSVVAALETRVRSLSAQLSATAKTVAIQYQEHELEAEDVERFVERIRGSAKRIQQTTNQAAERLGKAIATGEAYVEDEDAPSLPAPRSGSQPKAMAAVAAKGGKSR